MHTNVYKRKGRVDIARVCIHDAHTAVFLVQRTEDLECELLPDRYGEANVLNCADARSAYLCRTIIAAIVRRSLWDLSLLRGWLLRILCRKSLEARGEVSDVLVQSIDMVSNVS